MTLLKMINEVERIIGAAPGEILADLGEPAWDELWRDLREQHDRRNKFLAYGDDPRPSRHLQVVSPRISASTRAGTGVDRHNDPLRALPLAVAFEVLTGELVPRSRMVLCPVHEERTPSCKVDDDLWYCHGCGAGGSLYDLGAHLYGISPRGAAFFELRSRLATELLGGEEFAA